MPASATAARFSRAAFVVLTTATIAGILASGRPPLAREIPKDSRLPVSRHDPADARGVSDHSASRLTRAIGTGGPLAGVASYLRTRDGTVQVALYNRRDRRTYLLQTAGATQYTASIVKADILAQWLHRYQFKPGVIPVSIPYSIRYLMTNMITQSDNSAATALFYFGGGCTALTRFNRLIPTRGTTVGCQTPDYYGWGNTTTTAADQAAIIEAFAYRGRVLGRAARGYGLKLMESVIPAQRWGISCGPWGSSCAPPDYAHPVPGVTVALKNGWKYVPTCAEQNDTCPWQVNSIGWVRGQGRDYVLAVLTTDDPAGPGTEGLDYGITTIQGVSRLIWGNLQH
jgi:Beta-lactamase enzyme family